MGNSVQNTGTVKFYKKDKAYGFITAEQGNLEYFFHVTDCLEEVTKGDHVMFTLETTKRGVKAIDVKKA